MLKLAQMLDGELNFLGINDYLAALQAFSGSLDVVLEALVSLFALSLRDIVSYLHRSDFKVSDFILKFYLLELFLIFLDFLG